ncbi:hypothetical protein NDW01_42520, partial [Actinoallomurus sp. WRP6H-15]|nr:hypothetical protein [Actinoallomurus soli]
MSDQWRTDWGSWTTWEDYVGNLDLNAIFELGNQWITLGDDLAAGELDLASTIAVIGWRGGAYDTAQEAWHSHVGVEMNNAANAAWKIGEAINAYGKYIYQQAQNMADENNKDYLINILSFFLAVVTAPLSFGIGALISMLGKIIGMLAAGLETLGEAVGGLLGTVGEFTGDVVTSVASTVGVDIGAVTARIGPVVNTVGETVGGAVTPVVNVIGKVTPIIGKAAPIAGDVAIGATFETGMTLGIDTTANRIASAATHTPSTIDWGEEGKNLWGAAIGGGLGSGLLGIAARGGKPDVGVPGGKGTNLPDPPHPAVTGESGPGTRPGPGPTGAAGTGPGAGSHVPSTVKPGETSFSGPGKDGFGPPGTNNFTEHPGGEVVTSTSASAHPGDGGHAPNESFTPAASSSSSNPGAFRAPPAGEKAPGPGTAVPGDGRSNPGFQGNGRATGTEGVAPPVASRGGGEGAAPPVASRGGGEGVAPPVASRAGGPQSGAGNGRGDSFSSDPAASPGPRVPG